MLNTRTTTLKRLALEVLLFLALFSSASSVSAQNADSSFLESAPFDDYDDPPLPLYERSLSSNALVVPSAMIAYGLATLKTGIFRNVNERVRKNMWDNNPHRTVKIDNYLQFAPAAAVYILNLSGVKGAHNLKDRSLLYLVSNIFLNATVYPMKKLTKEERPDCSAYNSFPSGHTAEAFASAEFLRQEYKDVSAWYGVGGYAVATATGILRMYNNKHWMSDVVAGAGIGIISTKMAYWLVPKVTKKISRERRVFNNQL